jgi:hypothetical protein
MTVWEGRDNQGIVRFAIGKPKERVPVYGKTRGWMDALPAAYEGLRIEVHRDRCDGPYAKNRLAVVAREDEPEVMLTHALAHLRLRS